jgi:UDP-GlcNAc:undecaprenyl-phosphate/decaprenyl-phosphate GlcNAc-1-phosphate transferase
MLVVAASESPGTVGISLDEVLGSYIYVFYAAYIVGFIFTPIMRVIALHYGVVDEPDGVRKMHRAPVAYLGGVAVFLGWLAGLSISQFLLLHLVENSMPEHLQVNFSIVVGACAIVLVGIWDDILHMSPWKKILGQVFAASCLLQTGEGRGAAWMFVGPILNRTHRYLDWPTGDLLVLQNHWLAQCASMVFVVLLVVAFCNATNLMDGLDGLCGGVTAVVAAGFLFLAVHMAAHSSIVNVNLDAMRVVLGLALLGGVLGFVPFNFNPASIFMGDTGSMFLGYCCATMMIMFATGGNEGNPKWFLAALVMFSLPLLDTALALIRRWVNGRPLFSPDRYHIHHQLVARGFTIKRTVVIAYGLSLFFVILGAAVVYIRVRFAVAVWLVVFGSIIVAAYKMGMVHEKVAAVQRKPLGDSNSGRISQSVELGKIIEVKSPPPAGKSPENGPPGISG